MKKAGSPLSLLALVLIIMTALLLVACDQEMQIAPGFLATVSASMPDDKEVPGGTTDLTVATLRNTAHNGDVSINILRLNIRGARVLSRISVWKGETLLGMIQRDPAGELWQGGIREIPILETTVAKGSTLTIDVKVDTLDVGFCDNPENSTKVSISMGDDSYPVSVYTVVANGCG